jgi:hypothetical protein
MAVGTSGSGKSTLFEEMIYRQSQLPRTQHLYIDSKPRFRAEFELNGVSTDISRRYKAWDKNYGKFIPGSFVLPLHDVGTELKQVWRLGGNIAIAQAEKPEQWPLLMEAATKFYESSHGKIERLVYVNELSDFFEVKKIGGIFWLIARSGREKKCAIAAETQRPVYIPKVLLTEMKRLYLFQLDNEDDIKAIHNMGVPATYRPPAVEYSFLFWDKRLREKPPSGNYYKLDLM